MISRSAASPTLRRLSQISCEHSRTQAYISPFRRKFADSARPHKTYFQPEDRIAIQKSWWQRRYVKGMLMSIALTAVSAVGCYNFLHRVLPLTYPETDSAEDLKTRKEYKTIADMLPIVNMLRSARRADGELVWVEMEQPGSNKRSSPAETSSGPTTPNEYKDDVAKPPRRGYLHETLRGTGRVPLKWTWWNQEEKKVVSVIFIGWALSGWPRVAHGGYLATVLDEALGRTAIATFPARTGVTANLNVNYRKPCRTEQFYIVKTETVEATDRKSTVKGTIEDLNGTVYVEAKGIFVVPKQYKLKPIV